MHWNSFAHENQKQVTTNAILIIKSSYPKALLLEQLVSSLNVTDHFSNKFCAHVFQAYTEFSTKVHLENAEELAAEPAFCNDNI